MELFHRELYDITIIGSGPAGLYGAFYAGLREMKVKIIEAQDTLGGKVQVYPEKIIWDIGGLTPISGQQLIHQMVQQGLTFSPTVVQSQKVVKIERDDVENHFILYTDNEEIHYSKTVLLAVGGGIIRPMKLRVDNAERYEEGNLHYQVVNSQTYIGKTVLISGGGSSAVDWANHLAPVAKKVILTYRGDRLKSHEADISKLKEHQVELLFNTEIVSFNGDDNMIKEVILQNNETKNYKNVPVDVVMVNHGYERNATLLKESPLNIRLKDDYYVCGTAKGASTVPGLFAAGDILFNDHKLHLIAGAYQDAATAVNSAKKYIDPTAQDVAMVSSHNERLLEKNKPYLYQSN